MFVIGDGGEGGGPMSHCGSDQYDWLVSTVHVLQTNARALIGEEKVVQEAII